MGCQEERYEDRGSERNCVKHTVRRILDAQREAAGDSPNGCSTSCEQSIEDLLSPSNDRGRSRHTTIPFMLFCRDGCSTFVGSGFARGDHGRHFHCVESPVFKVRGFVRGSDNCARIELLEPVYHSHKGENGEERKDSHQHKNCGGSVCNFFDHRRIENFCYTGVCITVDLDCFCGISCLDPVTPVN